MNCGVSLGCAASVLGRSSLRLDVISGAVIMKITSSTSMTSISGVMLMSLIGWAPGLRSRRPKATCCPRSGRPAGVRTVAERGGASSQARDCRRARGVLPHHHFAQVVGEALELGLARADALAEDVVGKHC